MAFWHALTSELLAAHTAYVVVALAVLALLIRRLPLAERPRLRVPTMLLLVHGAILLASAIAVATGREPRWTRLAAEAFELLAAVNLALVGSFRLLLPAIGISLPRILIDLISALAVLVTLIVVGQHAGLSVAGLVTTSAVLTAVIGFALQDTLGNVMGGLALQMDRSVQVGDWISLGLGQPTGRVVEIRWRFTAIETRAWETVVVPNSMLMKGVVVVSGRRVGAPKQLRRQIDFFVDFRTPPGQVIDAITHDLVGTSVPCVAQTPPPHVLLIGIRDSVAAYQLRYWLDDLALDEATDSDVRVRLVYALRRADIEPAIPAQAVFVTSESTERSTRKIDTDAARRQRAIASVDLFAALAPELQHALAAELRDAPFTRGEAVTREGESSDGLFIILDGSATVLVGHGSERREVARLGAGEFFGEMALMTGEARAATVIADGELRCARIDKPALERAFARNPELAGQLAEVLASRRVRLEALRDGADESRRRRLDTAKQDLLGRISRFFGLPR